MEKQKYIKNLHLKNKFACRVTGHNVGLDDTRLLSKISF